jgi:tetratricopeptide (TPR) repeat protein
MMQSNFKYFFEEYFFLILSVHTIISFILAILLYFMVRKRFRLTRGRIKNDISQMMEINDISIRGKILKKLFHLSFHRYNFQNSVIFFFFYCFSMPVISYLAAFWIAYYLKTVRYKNTTQTTHVLNLDEFEMIFKETKRVFGESSLLEMMTNDYVPKSKKLRALAAMANNITPSNLQVIQETLRSKEDEIRLFGYALLNKAELSLSEKINQALRKLKYEKKQNHPDKLHIAILEKQLAHTYWEMVYTGFAQDVLEKEYLATIEQYATSAKEFFEHSLVTLKEELIKKNKETLTSKEVDQDQEETIQEELSELEATIKSYYEHFVDLTALMGKIYMRKKMYEEAIEAFILAIETSKSELNNGMSFLYPYVAEIYFTDGRYHLTKNVLNKAVNLEFNAKLYPIIQQWRA